MLFNSYIYVCLFLPLVVLGHFALARLERSVWQRLWLVAASLLFYGWWNSVYLLLLLVSMVVNYGCACMMDRLPSPASRRLALWGGILFNLGLLGYFKYADFFIANLNMAFGTQLGFLRLALPLAISFFTFQQVAFLVDSFRTEMRSPDFLSYCLFVCFFPQLIAGPIVHHSEMMPQFAQPDLRGPNWENLAKGGTRFVLGLFKKVLLADTFALWATPGFDAATQPTFAAAWVAALSYTLQLYFDFSGYTDMALGSARMLNIRLPENFLSPYKARSLQDFWRRWHVTLSRFLRDYLYIPLGGNRGSSARTLANLFLTFLLGGLWHGAGWTFVAWGALHGAGSVVSRLWSRTGLRLPEFAAWALTFIFVVFCWVFFRAENLADAFSLCRGMLGLHGVAVPSALEHWLGWLAPWGLHFGGTFGALEVSLPYLLMLAGGLGFVALLPDSRSVVREAPYSPGLGVAAAVLFVASFLLLNRPSEFIYFQF